jgi:hypothetical protein
VWSIWLLTVDHGSADADTAAVWAGMQTRRLGIGEMNIEVVRGSLPLVVHGRFKPWSIDAGHSKVLLRGFLGDAESEDSPRIFDVLFQDVSRISIADCYEDLYVVTVEERERTSEERRVGGNWRSSKMFGLKPGSHSDYIVAGFLFWAEVAVRANDPSPLMEEHLTPESVVGVLFKV